MKLNNQNENYYVVVTTVRLHVNPIHMRNEERDQGAIRSKIGFIRSKIEPIRSKKGPSRGVFFHENSSSKVKFYHKEQICFRSP